MRGTTLIRQQRSALRKNERQLRLALHAGAMGLWRIDLATSRAEWDEQVHRLQGWTPGTFPGTWEAFCSRVHPDDLPAVQNASRECNKRRRDFTVQFRVVWLDGSVHWIEDHGILDFDEGGRLTGITGLSMDITARKEADLALRAAKERADAAKGEFLSRTSHELRTPLNAILGFGQLLELDAASEAQRQSVGHILDAGRKLLGMVEQLLVVSRGQIDEPPDAAEPGIVPVDAALANAHAAVETLAAEARVRLHDPEDDTAGALLLARPAALQQALVHLLRNAVQYNAPGGEVWLRAVLDDVPDTRTNAGRARLSVQDDGPGISANDLERLFVPFERLGAERQGTVAGARLGLATARQLIQETDGTMGGAAPSAWAALSGSICR